MATTPSSTIPSYTVDQQKQTVSGQLSNLLDQDNPYMTQARNQGEQYANKRGLLNSSMGAQASQDAAIQAAMPIAQADATVHNQFASQKYSSELQKDVNNQTQGFEQSNMRLAGNLQKDVNNQTQGFEQSNMRLAGNLQKDVNNQTQGFEQSNMRLASTIQDDLNATNNEYQHGLMQREQDFAGGQNQAKFDQDWRMQMAEGSTEREVEALKQQAGLYAQFTKGVADINSADMRAGEKSTAVASLWSQFQKGSAIPNTLRDIKINSDGSVERTAPTQTEAEAQTQAASQAAASVPSEIQGDGGYYKSGYTRNESGALVDDQGKTKPASYTTRQGRASKTYNYSLVNGTWKAA